MAVGSSKTAMMHASRSCVCGSGLLGSADLLDSGGLGGGEAVWWALLLLVGPIGGLVLALQRPVRQWTGSHRVGRRAGRAR